MKKFFVQIGCHLQIVGYMYNGQQVRRATDREYRTVTGAVQRGTVQYCREHTVQYSLQRDSVQCTVLQYSTVDRAETGREIEQDSTADGDACLLCSMQVLLTPAPHAGAHLAGRAGCVG